MPGVQHDVIVDLGEPPQTLDHQIVIAPRQVGPPAAVEKERVATDEFAVDHEALAARRVARGVDQLDLDLADADHIARIMADQLVRGQPGGPGDPRDLVSLDVDRAVDVAEQVGHPGDFELHDRPTDVIGVIVRCQHTRDAHVVGFDGGDECSRVVGGVDQEAFAGRTVTDRIDEVHHLCGHLVGRREIAARKELTKIEAIVVAIGRSHDMSVRCVAMAHHLKQLVDGQIVIFGGDRVAEVSEELATAFRPGDRVVVDPKSGTLLHVPSEQHAVAAAAVGDAVAAFAALATCTDDQITNFFLAFAAALTDDTAFAPVLAANRADMERAAQRGRSTTRLELTAQMRADMIAGLIGWAEAPTRRDVLERSIDHEGWSVEARRAPLGVVGFVFEGRPNVFADAAGVLRTGNTVVFRIGSDALGTATAIVDNALDPALAAAGLPRGAVRLVASAAHAAGWALFSDARLSLAVARGSGPAVAQLGAVARQAGVSVSLHGTGGAWLVADSTADVDRFRSTIMSSLDRKVCNTLNVCCIVADRVADLLPAFIDAVTEAGASLGTGSRIHATPAALRRFEQGVLARRSAVARADGTHDEPFISVLPVEELGHEWEWEGSPEVSLHIVDTVADAVAMCNAHSPHFVASLISERPEAHDDFYATVDAPFVGDGMTRWVDGQYALDAPELGLSNWEGGRMLGRGGILSGDSVYTVRYRARVSDPKLRR